DVADVPDHVVVDAHVEQGRVSGVRDYVRVGHGAARITAHRVDGLDDGDRRADHRQGRAGLFVGREPGGARLVERGHGPRVVHDTAARAVGRRGDVHGVRGTLGEAAEVTREDAGVD